jgi:hypothetical protein
MELKLSKFQRETDESSIIHGALNTPLIVIDKSSRQKISKDIVKVSRIITHKKHSPR